MQHIDLKDRKILYELDLNCRQSNAQIGKKVGLSRKVVEYRIKRMEEEGIIAGYWARIDSYRFGYQVYRYYIIFQNATTAIKEEVIKNIADYKNAWVVKSIIGVYDVAAVIWVKSIPRFYQFWNKLNEKYGDYFAEKIFSVYLGSDCYPHSYLIKEENYKKDREKPQYVGKNEPIEITYQDYLLLESIATNARISTIQITEKLKRSSQSVTYNLNKLKENGIIQGYHIDIDTSKLGLHHFKVDIWLKEVSKREKIWDILKYNPHVIFLNTSAGYADLEMEFVIEDADALINFIENVSSQFPGVFRRYIYFRAKKNYKIRSLPELSEKDFKK
jgi:DNA-binding Lrp family transcriptional regulator